MRKIIHIVIPIDITTSRQTIEIEKGIPRYATEVLGISFSISQKNGFDADIRQVALISTDINNRATDVVYTGIPYKNRPITKTQDEYQTVGHKLHDNSRATIRIVDINTMLDKNGIWMPYTVNVYLKCLKKTT